MTFNFVKNSLNTILIILSLNTFLASQNEFTKELFSASFEEIESMLKSDYLSFKDAVFLVENAYFNNDLSYDYYQKEITLLSFLAKEKAKVSELKKDYKGYDKDKLKKFSALFSILKDTTAIIDNKDTLYHYPYTYDFDDMFGDESWSNMFVSKLLATKKGNCHSLPYLYKIIANEIGVGDNTYLALSPNHIFIKHHSQKVGFYNTELTSGFFPQDAWLKASGYIPLIAIQNGLFLVTLTEKESIALCLFDLAMGYDKKFRENDGSFIIKCCDAALKYYPVCIKAMLLKAETYARLWKAESNKEGVIAKELWKKMDYLYSNIHTLGYRQMPKEMYVQWLTEVEKAKYENKLVPKIKNDKK